MLFCFYQTSGETASIECGAPGKAFPCPKIKAQVLRTRVWARVSQTPPPTLRNTKREYFHVAALGRAVTSSGFASRAVNYLPLIR